MSNAAARGNKCLIDIDWMIGSGQIDDDGVDVDGGSTAIFPQRREWT
jgi:leucyl aminopeptidase (aminopeptidase T)